MVNFKVIVPFYNVEQWISTTIDSILSQKYNNFSCYVSDDVSTDDSLNILKEYKSSKLNIIENKQKKYALKNIYDTINFSNPDDEDVIVIVDGDDWLANELVLQKLNHYYSNENIFLTYGTYVEYPSGRIPWNVTQYSKEVVNNNLYRKDVWRASHLRTFKYKLWKNIDINDLKDSDGQFYKMTGDLATMFPMLEMSGGKHKCINEILYCYNLTNSLNDHKVDHSLQLSLEQKIRSKNKYKVLF